MVITSIRAPSRGSVYGASTQGNNTRPQNVQPSETPKETPKPKTYTIPIGDKSYTFTQDEIDWIKGRYQQTWAGSYALDNEDQRRKSAGAMPFSYVKKYEHNAFDKGLFEMGLPSAKEMEAYVGAYSAWYGDGQTYQFDKQTSDAISQKFKDSWEYEYTLEDQQRKAQGVMPAKIAAKYGDTLRDSNLAQSGLPPESMLADYVGAYEKTRSDKNLVDQFYYAVAARWYDNELNNANDEAARMKAFNDVLNDPTFAALKPLYKKTTSADESDPTTLDEYEKIWAAQAKESTDSDEPFISYANFNGQYVSYKKRIKTDYVTETAAMEAERQKRIGAIKTKPEAEEYVQNRVNQGDDIATILQDMYESGAGLTPIRRAKDALEDLYADDEESKKLIGDTFAAIKQQIKADKANGTLPSGLKGQEYDPANVWTKASAIKYVQSREGDSSAAIMADMYAAGVPLAQVRQAKNYLLSITEDEAEKDQIRSAFSEAKDAYSGERKAERAERKTQKEVLKTALVLPYEQGATSTMTAEEAAPIFYSHLVYNKEGYISPESLDHAIQVLVDAGVSTRVIATLGSGWETSGGRGQSAYNSAQFQNALKEVGLVERTELVEQARAKIVGAGTMTDFEFDQALRRVGWGDTVNSEKGAEHYYTEIDQPRYAENGDVLPTWRDLSDTDRAAYAQNFMENSMFNPEIHKSASEQIEWQLGVGIVAKAFAGMAAGVVNFADAAVSLVDNRTDRWEISKELSQLQSQAQMYNRTTQSGGSKTIGIASDVLTEVLRMYMLSSAGSGVASMAFGKSGEIALISSNATSATTKGLNTLIKAANFTVKSSPFIATSIGNYYGEAMQGGATIEQAVLYGTVCGTLEGALEAANASMWLERGFGSGKFAKQLIAGGDSVLAGPIVAKARLVNLVASSLGEFAEESVSYIGSTFMQKWTYNKDVEFDVSEMIEQGGMGALVGLFGGGLSMPSYSQSGIISQFLNTDAGMKWAMGEGSGAVQDLLFETVVAENLPQSVREQLQMQDGALSLEDYSAAVRDVEQNTRWLEERQRDYDTAIAQIDAELQKKQGTVNSIEAKMVAAKKNKKLWAKLAAQRDAAESELKVEQAQFESKRTERTTALVESTEGYKISRSKAQAKLIGHAVSMADAFRSEIKGMKSLVEGGATTMPTELGQTILGKMTAARAGRLADYMEASAVAAQEAAGAAQAGQAVNTPVAASPASTADVAHSQDNLDNAGAGAYINKEEVSRNGATEVDAGADSGIVERADRTTSGGDFAQRRLVGRGNSGSHTELLDYLAQSRSELSKTGVNDFGLSVTEDHVAFSTALAAMRAENSDGGSVDPKNAEDLAGSITFMNADGSVGGAVQPNGNIVAVFKNRRRNTSPRAGVDIILNAIALGGDRLDCYGAFLANTYAKAGMIPVARVAYGRGQNPEMDAYIDEMRAQGKRGFETDPDIYFMKLTDGATYESIVSALANGDDKQYTKAELDALPLMEYDEAEAYRDQLIEKAAKAPGEGASFSSDIGITAGAMRSKKELSGGRTEISQFFENTLALMDSDEHSTEVRNAAQAFDESYTYDVVAERESIAWAQERLARGVTPDVVEELRTRDVWSGKDVDVAMGIKEYYRQQAEATGDYTDYANWTILIADRVGEGGRALQALVKYTRDAKQRAVAQMQRNIKKAENAATKKTKAKMAEQTAAVTKAVDDAGATADKVESAVRKVAKETTAKSIKDAFVQLQNKEIDRRTFDKRIKDAIASENGLPTMSTEDAKRVMELLDTAAKQTDDYERRRYEAMAEKIVANTEGVSFREKFSSLQRIQMLLNPRTMVRNVDANILFTPVEWIKDVPATIADMIASKVTGERTTTISAEKTKAWFGGFKRGVSESVKDVKYGVTTGRASGKYEMANKDVWKSRFMQGLDNLVGYGLQMGDRPFYEAAYDEFLKNEELLGHDINSDEVQQRVVGLALDRVFQGKPIIYEMLKGLRDLLDRGDIPFGSLVLPFTQTPANLADKLIDYSPVGLVRAGRQLGKAHATGEFDQKLFVDRVGRTVTGTGLMIIGYALGKAGLIHLAGDDEKERQAMKNAGVASYSLQIGDTTISINWAEPVGSIIIMGATLAKLGAGSESLNVLEAGHMFVNSFFDNTVLSNVVRLFGGGYGDVASGLENFVLGSTTQFVPSILGTIARIADPYERDTYDSNPLLQQGKRILAYFPGLRNLLPFKYGTDGKPVESNYGETFVGRVVNTTINPALTDNQSDDVVNSEIYRLYQAGFDEQMLPVAAKTISGIKLTADQRRELQEMLGEACYEAALRVINGSSYSRLTNAQKAEAIADAVSGAATEVRKRFKKTLG